MTDFKKLREQTISAAKKTIKESVSQDELIIHAINNIDELAKVTAGLSKRLRDWYAIYFPELSKKIPDHEAFVKLVIQADKQKLMKEYMISESMGKDLDKKDLDQLISFAKRIEDLFKLRDELREYLEKITSSYCRNIHALIGSLLCAKLIREAGSLKDLAMMHASKVQLLGAESALFRHLKTGARPPKHGIILQHPLVGSAKKESRGKNARVLADKITLLARTDYFGGEFRGDKMRRELEEKLK